MKNKLKRWIGTIKKWPVCFIACILFIAVCALSLGITSNSKLIAHQPLTLSTTFSGEYKIADGDWQSIPANGHISATQGVVRLRGKFVLTLPDGEIATDNLQGCVFNFYCNHLSVQMQVGEETVVFDVEHPQLGVDACGVMWMSYVFPQSVDGTTLITLSNPHNHGNESAVDEFLNNIIANEQTSLASDLSKQYDVLRYTGFAFIAIAAVVFVFTIVSAITKSKTQSLWIIGCWMLFTGCFYILDVKDVFFWNANAIFNTTALAFCQVLSLFFLGVFTATCLSGKNRVIAYAANAITGFLIATLAVLSSCGVIRIFDARFYWNVAYACLVAVLIFCCIREAIKAQKGKRFILICCMVSTLSVVVDFAATSFAWWTGWYLSKSIFCGMFIVAIAFGIYTILSNHKMSIRTKEMETQLKDKSIAVMISQIQPHFLYNSLNTIAELCVVDPKRAEKATVDFSRYLRGNMGALNEKKTIEFEDELNHLKHYIELEKLRYGDDLQFEYDIQESAFTLPALTVQPLVENAVNHGIRYHKMKGKVKIASRADESNFYVVIQDDGVGFDPNESLVDDGKHIGIANVKYRLAVMCGGSVDIQSEKGIGTVVTIVIPKENKR